MDKVIIYVLGVKRESTPGQKDSVNPEIQEQKIKYLAEELGKKKLTKVKIVHYLDLAESATGGKQPLQQAIDWIANYNPKNPLKKITYLLFMDFKRQGRSGVLFYADLKRQLAKLGVSPLDSTGIISEEKRNTLESFGVKYSWSEYQPTEKSEYLAAEEARDNFRDIMTQLIGAEINYARLGYIIRNSLFGFQNEKVDTPHGKRVVLKPHPIEYPWMVTIFERLLEGRKTDDEIIAEVNLMGFTTRTRKGRDANGNVTNVRGGKPLTPRLLNFFKTKTDYAGVNNEKWVSSQGYAVKFKFPVLITIAEFNRINRGVMQLVEKENDIVEVIRVHNKPVIKSYGNLETYPFKAFIACPTCGKLLFGSASRGKLGKHYPAYHHSGDLPNKHYFRVSVDGDNGLEATVAKFLSHVKFSKKALANFEDKILARYESRQIDEKQKTIDLQKRVTELNTQQKDILQTIKQTESPIVIKMLSDDVDELEKQKKEATDARNNKEIEEIDIATTIATAKYYLEHLDDLIMTATNPAVKGALFSLIFQRIPTYQELVIGTPILRPIFELKDSKNASVGAKGFEPLTYSV